MHSNQDCERGVDGRDPLEHPSVGSVRQLEPTVLFRNSEAEQPDLRELIDHLFADRLFVVEPGGVDDARLFHPVHLTDEPANDRGFAGIGAVERLREREKELVVHCTREDAAGE